ncbi:MAG: hypothetical protein KAI81_02140, partial [Candidatus Marinimicrobia bacterium]|nr:hypothetical protein [Candidatus Neomarinimicrobiota bacterium]
MIKKNMLGLVLVMLTINLAFSQKILLDETLIYEKQSMGMSGTPLLNTPELIEYLEKYGNSTDEIKMTKSVADAIGDVQTFFVYNFSSDDFDNVEFKLLSKGNYSQVWCASGELANNHIDQSIADSFLVYLETKTGPESVDPTKGVIAIDREYYGDPPNKDGDGLTDVFICDIKDSWTPEDGGVYMAGFFYRVDQYVDLGTEGSYRSNERDVIYIDSYPNIYTETKVDIMSGILTTAHEFQHLIHYNYDPLEYTLINEGLSENAEYITGMYTRSAHTYLSNVNIPIFHWDGEGDVIPDYARASLFYNYIGDRFGVENYKHHVQNYKHGSEGIDTALVRSGFSSVSFVDLIHDFHIANMINNKFVNEKYGYLNPAREGLWIPEHAAHRVLISGDDTSQISLYEGGGAYLSFDYISSQNA